MAQSLTRPPRSPGRPRALWRDLPFTAQLLVIGMLVGLGWFLASRAADEQQLAAARERSAELLQLQRAELTAARLGTSLAGMSRAHRGFLLTGSGGELVEYDQARKAFELGVARLLEVEPVPLVADDLEELVAALAVWQDSVFAKNVARRRAGGLSAFAEGTEGARGVRLGAQLMDSVTMLHERMMRDLREAAQGVELRLESDATRDEVTTFLTSTGALAVLLLLLTLLMRLVARALAQVTAAAQALDAGKYAQARLPDAHRAPNREMALLASSFEDLAASIERRERQLQDDIEKLKELERLKRDFVSTVSHELRTPLTSMRGALGLMLGGKVGEITGKGRDLLQIAMTNTERLIRLINDILDIEKMDAGQMHVRREPLRLRPLVEQTVAQLEGFAQGQRVTLSLVSEPTADAELIGDPDRLIQVLTNLISNAVKFSPNGAAVEIAVIPSGQTVTVRVRDHGPGIPEEFAARIFGRFQQAGGADSRKSGGTGLGLNIARTIVELHAGRIGFDPAEGGGTVFWFTLPTTPTRASAPSGDVASSAPDHRRAVLVVEDDASMRAVLVALVEPLARPIPVVSAEEAQAVLAAEPVAAIILDPGLPGMDGFTFAKALRQDPQLRTLPLFLFSAFEHEPEVLRKAGIRAADAYVKTRDSEAVLFDRLKHELETPR